MKLSPMMLFLIILIILVISIVVGKSYTNEGFISFAKNTAALDTQLIQCYSKTRLVTKIEDNFYFDSTNGNMIQIDGSIYTNTSDSLGKTISKLQVLPRAVDYMWNYPIDTAGGTVAVVQDTKVSSITGVSSSYQVYVWENASTTATPASIAYIPWQKDTYIIPIMQSGNDISVNAVYYFSGGSSSGATTTTPSPAINSYYEDTDASNNTMVTDNYYDVDRKVYQISHYVRFDVKNANLIIDSDKGTKQYYSRTGTRTELTAPITSSANTNTISSSTPASSWVTLDASGQNIVVYMPNGQNTVVALVSFQDSSKKKLILNNVVRFTPTGPDTGSSNTTCDLVSNAYYKPSTCKAGGCNWDYSGGGKGYCTSKTPLRSTPYDDDADDDYDDYDKAKRDAIRKAKAKKRRAEQGSGYWDELDSSSSNDYLKWYWKNNGDSNGASMSDYMLKTQIIPPVCPSCSSCPSCTGSGTCTNCGGKGGSGTVASSGKSMFDSNGQPNMYDNNGNLTSCAALGPNGVGYDANLMPMYCNSNDPNLLRFKQSIAGQSNPSNNGIGGVNNNGLGGVANNVVNTTGGIIGGTIGGVGQLANKAIDTTSNLLTSAGSGASNLLTSVGTGVSNLAKPGQGGYGGQAGQGVYNNTTKQLGNNQRSTYYGTHNQSSEQSPDQYSYYGQLPSKGGSNYMPLTTDFSAFGK